jgi:hypothetical protein
MDSGTNPAARMSREWSPAFEWCKRPKKRDSSQMRKNREETQVKAGWNEMLIGDMSGGESIGQRDFRSERALMVAVLLDALSIFYKLEAARDHRQRLEFREVYTWIYVRGGDGPFCYENVCAAVGINAEALRESLKRGRRVAKQRERHFRPVARRNSEAKAA